jgi:hypothetical protein
MPEKNGATNCGYKMLYSTEHIFNRVRQDNLKQKDE